jgi:selenocysteine lyase/cysteine desulfurase
VRVLRAGAKFVQSIGLSAIESRVRELSTYCLKAVKKAGLRTMTPEAWEERAQIVNVVASDAEGVMNALREKHRIIVNVKDGAVRISVSFFNTEEDIEKTVGAIVQEIGRKQAAA